MFVLRASDMCPSYNIISVFPRPLQGSYVNDLLMIWCCTLCALVQERRVCINYAALIVLHMLMHYAYECSYGNNYYNLQNCNLLVLCLLPVLYYAPGIIFYFVMCVRIYYTICIWISKSASGNACVMCVQNCLWKEYMYTLGIWCMEYIMRMSWQGGLGFRGCVWDTW